MAESAAVRRLALVWASWFGAGYFPVASGTAGTLAALPLVIGAGLLDLRAQLVISAIVTLTAMPAAAVAGRALGVVDAKQIVIDEVAGILITMLAVPLSVPSVIAGFLLFRAFDILKPWPASYFDRRVKNGAGVVLDDVVAGLFARLSMGTLAWLFPAVFA